ncbi:hypothetical protein FPV67DRAFT_1564292 [Lyophyllum atratum]|nr:hypothetical protein FPV67DRAFT_1564292 [Lyophyllum atratum]
MPPCPRCSKKFKDESRVLAHMNQPYSSCHNHQDDLIQISEVLRSCAQRQLQETDPAIPSDSQPGITPPVTPPNNQGEDFEMDVDNAHSHPCFIEKHPSTPRTYGRGQTLMDVFDEDPHADKRTEKPYYPFASRQEWELASFLLYSNLSMASINSFLKLELITQLRLSFPTAEALRGRAELLPTGPKWYSKPCRPVYPTKKEVHLYYRDPIECLQSLLHSPLVKDFIPFEPFRMFRTAEKVVPVYTEWLSGETAWDMQSQLPPGATLLGTVLSSDKTTFTPVIVSAMTGNRMTHPLLINLANLDMDFRVKSSNHAYLLLALLPIPKFTNTDSDCHGMLVNTLFHECLDDILAPLKKAAEVGIMMSDPVEHLRSKTLAQLKSLESNPDVDPWDIEAYRAESAKLKLNGVHRPFWRDWPMSDPSVFLTPEPLHHWRKAFWDHDSKWCIKAVGNEEIDFRSGISKLNQVTGREHRDIQRYLISVVAGCVPKRFLIAVRVLMDFRYLAQSSEIDDPMCQKIDEALAEFHRHKQAILDSGSRCGKRQKVIDNWGIPKLELLQSVVPSIRANSVASQWSADATEHAHITEIKIPAQASNNQNYESQICRYLDRLQKCRHFDLTTAMRDNCIDFRAPPALNLDEENEDDWEFLLQTLMTTSSLLAELDSVSPLSGSTRITVDYFALAQRLLGDYPNAPEPLRTVASNKVAFHLIRDPNFRRMTVDDVAENTAFRGALRDYLTRLRDKDGDLPFTYLDVWTRVRIQQKTYHYPYNVLPPDTVNANPPSDGWPLGWYDAVLINTDSSKKWPLSGIHGHAVVQLRLIFRIVPSSHPQSPSTAGFLSYAQCFDIVPQLNPKVSGSSTVKGPYPDPTTMLYIIKRAKRRNHSTIRALVDLTPHLRDEADHRLSKTNAMEYVDEYWLNKYFTKELFYSLHLAEP